MKILCLSTHTDDAESGCGGSIAKFIGEGEEVYLAVFSLAEESLPKGLSKETTLCEQRAAAKVLGIKSQNLFIYRYHVRRFPQFRQEILEDLVELKQRINPDLVFAPCKYDSHQDHHTIAMEAFRAFKFSSVLGYEISWNNAEFKTTAFIALDETLIERKIKAIGCYESQALRVNLGGKGEKDLGHIRALACVRGRQINIDYAEAFDVVRWIIK